MKNIKTFNEPFILWATARTGSTAFYYSYVERSQQDVLEPHHEPLNFVTNESYEDFKKSIAGKSFKCMLNGYGRDINRLRIFKKILNDIPVMPYRHIILYRRNMLARQKSLLFSMANDIWDPQRVNKETYSGWTEFHRDYMQIGLEAAYNYEKSALDEYVNLINIFNRNNIPYQLVEFEDACEYIGEDTSQNTSQYYEEINTGELEKQLDTLKDHEFFNYA